MISVIIPCGGKSTRMGGVDKLFLKINGLTTIERTILAFSQIEIVKEIIVCCSDTFETKVKDLIKSDINKLLKFAPNGNTRQESVYNGFSIANNSCNFICVHDGARPLISTDTIIKAVSDAKEYGSAVVCVPCKDTVKISDGFGTVRETPSRERLFLTQTPQIFKYEQYEKSITFARKNLLDFTDDSQMFETIGIMPHITIGEYSNIKITTPEDVVIAEQILKQKDLKG